MRYYKVLPNADGYKVNNDTYLIAGELFTETEVRNLSIPNSAVTPVEVSKRSVYFSFGARFSSESK